MAKKQRSESQKQYFNAYPSKASKNREKRAEKHSKQHPNDNQKGSTSYRRKAPQSESGWLTAKMDAELTPKQTTPISDKKSKEAFIPDCAQHLKDMFPKERKQFAELYSKMKRVHNAAQYENGKKKKAGKKSK